MQFSIKNIEEILKPKNKGKYPRFKEFLMTETDPPYTRNINRFPEQNIALSN